VLLTRNGLAESRERAQALILAGKVRVAGETVRRPDRAVNEDAPVAVESEPAYASRGALKLAPALDRFGVEPAGRICADIGASTGGFTEVLLSRGARRVYAVDVGRGQLDWRLRQDPRVVIRERLNARYLTSTDIPEAADIITCDASFIGLATVLPAPLALAAEKAQLVALVKPQFEAGPAHVGKGGVVRDPEIHREVCERVAAWVAALPGWSVVGNVESPILGPEGNREFLLYARRGGEKSR
jgi:23S rRNA (cytidine1920-2'-O)/16S rRNA (cytidine1409-2'-O)-methyltransferase